MDVLSLPFLSPEASLERAWRAMERYERSAVVTYKGDRFVLVPASRIVIAMNRGRHSLGQASGRRLRVLRRDRSSRVRQYAQDTAQLFPAVRMLQAPHRRLRPSRGVEAQLEPLLSRIRHDGMGLVDTRGRAALVLTGREVHAKPYAGGPRRCYCENPYYSHGFDHGRTGSRCSLDGYRLCCRR